MLIPMSRERFPSPPIPEPPGPKPPHPKVPEPVRKIEDEPEDPKRRRYEPPPANPPRDPSQW